MPNKYLKIPIFFAYVMRHAYYVHNNQIEGGSIKFVVLFHFLYLDKIFRMWVFCVRIHEIQEAASDDRQRRKPFGAMY